VIDDPGKRVTSIVPGDPAYVVTADGTRYFEGALLPTGHRVAAIRDREVLLERNGTKAPLRF
jgi:type III secretion protein D